MTKQGKIRSLVLGLLLAVGVGAPVASIVGNAPRAAAATASTETLTEAEAGGEYVMPEEVLRGPTTIGEVTVVGSPAKRAPAKAAPAQRSCRRIALEQQGIGYESHVTMCEG